jgi:hypothetical protein
LLSLGPKPLRIEEALDLHFHNVEEEMALGSVVDLHHLGVNLELRLVHAAEAQDGCAIGLDERAILVIDSLIEGCDLEKACILPCHRTGSGGIVGVPGKIQGPELQGSR